MDHIYPTKDYKVYKIKDEVRKLKESLKANEMPKDFADIAKIIGIRNEKLMQISMDLCNSYKDFGDDKPSNAPSPFSSFPDEALELNIVKRLRDGNFKFKEKRVREVHQLHVKPEAAEEDLKPYEESVITVRFYEPFHYKPTLKNQPRFHQEFQVLGSSFLTELRDSFYCQCNQAPLFDISDDPLNESTFEADAPNPGFFFIHDTFYNDTRNPNNCDYSEVILNWFKKFNYREFRTASMEQTKFEDLSIRVGYPSVYQHHGACEHVFCITSVDLLDQTHSLRKSDYPFMIATHRKRSTLCDICNQTDASYLVTNCAIHVKDPMRVCHGCYFSLHYESDGITKTCSFNAYRIYSVRPEKLKSNQRD